jgi:hypothetical protein
VQCEGGSGLDVFDVAARIEHPRPGYECGQKQSCGELLRRAGPTWPGILQHLEGEAVCKGDYDGLVQGVTTSEAAAMAVPRQMAGLR